VVRTREDRLAMLDRKDGGESFGPSTGIVTPRGSSGGTPRSSSIER